MESTHVRHGSLTGDQEWLHAVLMIPLHHLLLHLHLRDECVARNDQP